MCKTNGLIAILGHQLLFALWRRQLDHHQLPSVITQPLATLIENTKISVIRKPARGRLMEKSYGSLTDGYDGVQREVSGSRKVKVKQSRYRPGQAQKVPGS